MDCFDGLKINDTVFFHESSSRAGFEVFFEVKCGVFVGKGKIGNKTDW